MPMAIPPHTGGPAAALQQDPEPENGPDEWRPHENGVTRVACPCLQDTDAAAGSVWTPVLSRRMVAMTRGGVPTACRSSPDVAVNVQDHARPEGLYVDREFLHVCHCSLTARWRSSGHTTRRNPPPPAPVTFAPVAPAARAASTASSRCEFDTPEASARLASQLLLSATPRALTSPSRRPLTASPARSRNWFSCGRRSAIFAVCSPRMVSALRVMPVKNSRSSSGCDGVPARSA